MSSETYSFADADEPKPATKQPHSDAQKLLDWLQRWHKPTISTRDIRNYAPQAIRNRESAISSIEVLVRHGWLIALKPRQRNYRIWQIVRKPIVHPTVAA